MHNKLSTGAVPPRYQQYVIDLNEHIPLKMDQAEAETMEEKIYILEDNNSNKNCQKLKTERIEKLNTERTEKLKTELIA
jgi:hypothetical protein